MKKRVLLISFFATALVGLAQELPPVYSTFQNGKEWLDDRGKHINAHGGQILTVDGVYYWIGEQRDGFTSRGVSCYSSTDLFNWKYEGLCLTMKGPMSGNMQDIGFGRLLERPKVIYNEKSKKYVMWAHWENGAHYGEARAMVAVADKITGPFKFVKTFRPHEQMSRDQTLFMDTDGKAYQFRSSEENATTQISELSENFLDVSDPSEAGYKRIFISQSYEAPTVMKYNSRYYGIFSGCTGWAPNAAKLAVSTSVKGVWSYLSNPCCDDNSNTTYDSQGTFIFKVPGRENAFIFMADRWNSSDVGSSTYVWAPISLRTGRPTLHWEEEWDLSFFDQINKYEQINKPESGKEYYLLAKHSDKFLSDQGGQVVQHSDDTSSNLLLKITDAGEGWYRLQNKDNLFLTAGDGLSFVAQTNGDNQLWKLQTGQDRFYYISSKAENKVLDVGGESLSENAGVGLYPKKNEAGNQMFGFFRLKDLSGVEETSTVSSYGLQAVYDRQNKQLEISADISETRPSVLLLSDMNGRKLKEIRMEGEKVVILDIPELNAGIYIVSLFGEKGKESCKAVVY